MRVLGLWCCLTASFLLSVASSAHARDGAAREDAGEEPGAPPSPAPDVVQLEDGTVYRGTIAEKVPDSHVVVVLITGDVRRASIETVVYAGTANRWPGAAAPESAAMDGREEGAEDESPEEFLRRQQSGTEPVTSEAQQQATEVPDGKIRIRIEPSHANLSIYAGAPGTRLKRLCLAPCEAFLDPGSYRFIVKSGDGSPVWAKPDLMLYDSTILETIYESRKGLRIAGAVLVALGGAALAAAGAVFGRCGSACKGQVPWIALPVAAVISGAVMIGQGDRAKVHRSRRAPGEATDRQPRASSGGDESAVPVAF
jgi:hypothetical protein